MGCTLRTDFDKKQVQLRGYNHEKMNQNSIFTNVPLNEFKELVAAAVRSELSGMKSNDKESTKTEFLTRKQTADRLKISLPTLHLWTRTGTIQGYRISGRVLYKSAEIESSLQAMKTIKNR